MTRILIRLWLLSLGIPALVQGQDSKFGNAHLGFVYPISTNGTRAGEYTNKFSLHAIEGISKNETGFSLYGLVGIIKDSASGLQIAGFSNTILNQAHGIQIAGFLNFIKNKADGLQIAGFTNINGRFDGLQIAGFTNIDRTSNGLQIAGFCNLTQKSETGFQIGGFFNTAGNIDMQIAGFFNKAEKVRGVQIAGFLNIADSSEYPVGIINIIKNGEQAIGLSIDETLTSLLSFRSGSRYLYGILGVGYNWKKDQSLYALEFGLGAHLITAGNFRLNSEAAEIWLTKFEGGENLRSSLRILPAIRIGRQIELYGGPTVNYVNISNHTGQDLVSHYFWTNTSTDRFQGMYFGVIGGIQITL